MRNGAAVIGVLFVLSTQIVPARAMDEQRPVVLHSVSGTVSYQSADGVTPVVVDGAQVFREKAYVSTQANSVGTIVFPDTSQLTLGPNSTVQAYDFQPRKKHVFRKRYAYFWEGSTIRLSGTEAALRLDVRNPDDVSDYVVLTRFARIDVRGTSALLSDSPGGDIITCIDCGAGDVVADIGGEDYVVGDGQTLVIGAQGRVTLGDTNDLVTQGFAASGLSTARLPQPKPPDKRIRFKWTPPFAKRTSS